MSLLQDEEQGSGEDETIEHRKLDHQKLLPMDKSQRLPVLRLKSLVGQSFREYAITRRRNCRPTQTKPHWPGEQR